jgi:2-phospho-L-lactate/phosphoenolpyruvate guanylyltransferase
MAAILVPFRGAEGKRRLAPATPEARVALGLAMLADVLAACAAVDPTTVVTNDEAGWRVAAELEVDHLAGGPLGQGAAVGAAIARLDPARPLLVVNADLPCLQPDDLRALLEAIPDGGIALAPAADGTTNALALADPDLFRPLYGPGSAERFVAHAGEVGVAVATVDHPNLADDVDSLEDLRRYERRTGPRTQMALAMAGLAPVA